jgi:hypothetical protein
MQQSLASYLGAQNGYPTTSTPCKREPNPAARTDLYEYEQIRTIADKFEPRMSDFVTMSALAPRGPSGSVTDQTAVYQSHFRKQNDSIGADLYASEIYPQAQLSNGEQYQSLADAKMGFYELPIWEAKAGSSSWYNPSTINQGIDLWIN